MARLESAEVNSLLGLPLLCIATVRRKLFHLAWIIDSARSGIRALCQPGQLVPMQALNASARVSVELSKTCKGKPRRRPVWVMRYPLPFGKDSRKVLALAWTKRGRPPHGYLTEREALTMANVFAAEHSTDTADARRTFAVGLAVFLSYCREEKGLRGSTLHGYARIGGQLEARPWRGRTWAEQVLDTLLAR